MNKTAIYSLQKNEMVCSDGMYIFLMYSLLFGIEHVLAKHDFSQLLFGFMYLWFSIYIYMEEFMASALRD